MRRHLAMKRHLFILSAQMSVIAALHGQPFFTNFVKIEGSLYWSLSDDYWTVGSEQELLHDLELDAYRPLTYHVKNTGPAFIPLVGSREYADLVLSLYDQKSNNVPKTPLGASLSKPAPNKPFRRNSAWFHHLGPDVGETTFRQMCSVADYFLVKPGATYVLEARLRYWRIGTGGNWYWSLTAPVRLPVIVPSPKASSAGRQPDVQGDFRATNAHASILAPDTNSLGGIRTSFIADAVLKPEELAAVVRLAKSCGMGPVATVETFHYLPLVSRGISVISVERTNGRKVTFDTVEVFREGWAYRSKPVAPAPVKSDGEFWVESLKALTVHELTTFITPTNTVRVNVSPGIPTAIADRIVKAFTTGRIKYSDEFVGPHPTGADFSQPGRLSRAEKRNQYEISFSSGRLDRYEFILVGDDVRILSVIFISI